MSVEKWPFRGFASSLSFHLALLSFFDVSSAYLYLSMFSCSILCRLQNHCWLKR
jgi:hypothetical protein